MSVAEIRSDPLAGLALLPRWITWRDDDGRKVPYTPDGKRRAGVNKPAMWGTRAETVGDKIGIVLGSGLGGIDLDSCFTESGEPESWAAAIIAAVPTYWEISPSGTGLHALFRYRLDDLTRFNDALQKHGYSHNRPSELRHKPGAAIYVEDRYFTVSGERFAGEHIGAVPAEQLLPIIENLASTVVGAGRTKKRPPDESRSGRAFRLALKTVALDKGKRSFLHALEDDPDLADWAAEKSPYNEDRAWEQAEKKFGWMREWKRNNKGTPYSNLDNVLQSLRHAEQLAGLYGYDEMARTELLLKPEPRPLRDTDVVWLQEYLQENWLIAAGKDTVFSAVSLVASERAFHPVRDYLKRLDWDGVDRLDTWLAAYLSAAQSAYSAAVGRMFMVQMVARIFRPGCKADYTLILEGSQGTEKSTALAVLADSWFSDSLPDIRTASNHNVSQHLNGKWLIEISEMSAMDKADAAALKSFLTRRVEQYRPSYGRKEVYEPRQCVFVGTTNKTAYLRDETGGRRYWPVMTSNIDLDGLRRDRDQLFAEAVARFQRDEPWWPGRAFEAEHMRPEQEARYEADPWEGPVIDYLDRHVTTTVRDVARSALNIADPQVGTRETRRITAILERAGYIREKDRHGLRLWVDPVFQL